VRIMADEGNRGLGLSLVLIGMYNLPHLLAGVSVAFEPIHGHLLLSGRAHMHSFGYHAKQYGGDWEHGNPPFRDQRPEMFELGIPARHFPIARAMRLQIHLMQNPANRRRTDSRHNLLGDRLPRPTLARPMSDVHSLRHRLKTGQLDNLRPLQGGKSAVAGLRAASALLHRSYPFAHNGGTLARPCSDHIATATSPLEPVRRLQSPARSGHAGLDTRVGFGCVPFAAKRVYRPAQFAVLEVCDHA
jgi:hypothetical protein